MARPISSAENRRSSPALAHVAQRAEDLLGARHLLRGLQEQHAAVVPVRSGTISRSAISSQPRISRLPPQLRPSTTRSASVPGPAVGAGRVPARRRRSPGRPSRVDSLERPAGGSSYSARGEQGGPQRGHRWSAGTATAAERAPWSTPWKPTIPVLHRYASRFVLSLIPEERLRVRPDQLGVQEGQHGDLVVAADDRDDRLDVRVGERGVDVAGALAAGVEPIFRVAGYSTGSSPNSSRSRSQSQFVRAREEPGAARRRAR